MTMTELQSEQRSSYLNTCPQFSYWFFFYSLLSNFISCSNSRLFQLAHLNALWTFTCCILARVTWKMSSFWDSLAILSEQLEITALKQLHRNHSTPSLFFSTIWVLGNRQLPFRMCLINYVPWHSRRTIWRLWNSTESQRNGTVPSWCYFPDQQKEQDSAHPEIVLLPRLLLFSKSKKLFGHCHCANGKAVSVNNSHYYLLFGPNALVFVSPKN
jgi:hypothetical protein